jgi:hypothetical protein
VIAGNHSVDATQKQLYLEYISHNIESTAFLKMEA